jgi:hypothetical protein
MQFDRIRSYRIKVAGALIADAQTPHARALTVSHHTIAHVGKRRLPEGGKQRLNKNHKSTLGFTTLAQLSSDINPREKILTSHSRV